ncbi:MAG: hypothetical protein HF314_16785 [Ignavibacteria bacterium]|jgi:hypothetical protein|nr:hypothetical protein [Ignavibacteria bacterium]MCU7504741.1 hypothetical protein [Ignavibacteria bacterium]MCU7516343.1 hypothetical protein [Ignavibacteria bacterium]
MKLEDKISKAEVSYIYSMNFNSRKKLFTLNLAKSPEPATGAKKKLTFKDVSNFLIDEETVSQLDQILGIGEYREEEKVKYVFLTEQRTFMFWTDKEPLISDVV